MTPEELHECRLFSLVCAALQGLVSRVDSAPANSLAVLELSRSVDELETSVRTANAIQNLGVKTVGELVQLTEAELLKMPQFGRKSLKDLKAALALLGCSIGMLKEGPKINQMAHRAVEIANETLREFENRVRR